MVDAKKFLDYLCTNKDYRFFTGTLLEHTDAINKYMHPDILYYTQAVTANTALGIALGVFMAGFKSVVMLSSDEILSIANLITRHKSNHPFMFLVGYDEGFDLKTFKKFFTGVKVITLEEDYATKLNKIGNNRCVVLIKKGILQQEKSGGRSTNYE